MVAADHDIEFMKQHLCGFKYDGGSGIDFPIGASVTYPNYPG